MNLSEIESQTFVTIWWIVIKHGQSTPDRPSVAQSFSQEDGKLVVWKHAPKSERVASSETVFTGGEAHISCTAHKARFMDIYR